MSEGRSWQAGRQPLTKQGTCRWGGWVWVKHDDRVSTHHCASGVEPNADPVPWPEHTTTAAASPTKPTNDQHQQNMAHNPPHPPYPHKQHSTQQLLTYTAYSLSLSLLGHSQLSGHACTVAKSTSGMLVFSTKSCPMSAAQACGLYCSSWGVLSPKKPSEPIVIRWLGSRARTCLLISSSHFCTRWLQSRLAGSQDSQRGSLIRFHAMMVGSSR